MPTISTLGHGSKRTNFTYTGDVETGVTIHFEKAQDTKISAELFRAILIQFRGRTIPGGFSMTNPTRGGLGEWIMNNSTHHNKANLTPRHASFIAGILCHEDYIQSDLKGNAVYLIFPSKKL